jgi:thiopeptide-type bacteriocin biosynthesis protein
MTPSTTLVDDAETCLRDLRLLAERLDGQGTSLAIVRRSPALAEFLAVCARSLRPGHGPPRVRYSDEITRARDVFVRAGLEALTAGTREVESGWLQVGLRPREDPAARGELCRQLARLARRLLGDSTADDFFFMNKPPGMRLRFRTSAPGGAPELADVLHAEVARWRAEGLIDHVEPGVYEPESRLFGGPRSMPFVHALFTVDSLVWLDYHACRAIEGDAVSPAWLVSLAMLRTVFAGLDITGWEDVGVWDCIRNVAGRRLGGEEVSVPAYGAVADEIRGVWSRADRIVDALHPPVRETLARHDAALLTGAAHWRAGYFCRPGASLGPRAAAAFYVIFHWNRAALSHTEQALVAESLSNRVLEDVCE